MITNDTNDDNYYDYTNINPNTCNLNFNYGGYSSEIYTPYGTAVINANDIELNSGVEVYCEFDGWNEYVYELNTESQEYGSLCNDTNILNNINLIKDNPNIIVLPNPHSNTISCNNSDCVIYASPQLNTITSPMNINCNTGLCSIVWYVHLHCNHFV